MQWFAVEHVDGWLWAKSWGQHGPARSSILKARLAASCISMLSWIVAYFVYSLSPFSLPDLLAIHRPLAASADSGCCCRYCFPPFILLVARSSFKYQGSLMTMWFLTSDIPPATVWHSRTAMHENSNHLGVDKTVNCRFKIHPYSLSHGFFLPHYLLAIHRSLAASADSGCCCRYCFSPLHSSRCSVIFQVPRISSHLVEND